MNVEFIESQRVHLVHEIHINDKVEQKIKWNEILPTSKLSADLNVFSVSNCIAKHVQLEKRDRETERKCW